MLIDFHTHVFPEKIVKGAMEVLAKAADYTPFSNGSIFGLLDAMERANCDVSVVMPVCTKPSQFDSINRFALEINEDYSKGKRRLISFGGIHPLCDDIKSKMKFLSDSGFLGVKIHPDYQGEFINCDGYKEIFKCAKDLNMIVLTHAGVDDGYKGEKIKCPPILAREIVDEFNYNKIVFAHFGGHKMIDDVYKYLAGKDVFFDTAFTMHEINKEDFIKILTKHGSDKILFATDSPWRDIKTDFDIIKSFNLDKNTENNIFYKNAIKLLGEKL